MIFTWKLKRFKTIWSFLCENTTYTAPFEVFATTFIHIASPATVFLIYKESFSTIVTKSDGVPSSWVKANVGPVGLDVVPKDFAVESVGNNVVPNGLLRNVSIILIISSL